MSRRARRLHFLSLSIVTGALLAGGASALTFAVNSTLDEIDDDTADGTCHTAAGTCTLRAAVMQANQNSTDTTITLPAGTYALTLPAASGGAGDENGDLEFLPPLSGSPVIALSGSGAATTIIDAKGIDRVLQVDFPRTATIAGVTLRNGVTTEIGGGVANLGSLTVSYSTLSGNSAVFFGGGIYNGGTLTLSHCTLSGNTVVNSGGGLHNQGDGVANVVKSTISGNTAHNDGGGISNDGSLIVTSSTISSNSSDRNGGGISNSTPDHVASVISSTIAFNQADADADVTGGTGGGIWTGSSPHLNMRSSVVAGNYLAGQPSYDDCAGLIYSFGRNKFSTLDGCTVGQTPPGDFTLLGSLDELGTLQFHGGSTRTIALVAPSDLIDGGEATQGCLDQDGIPLSTDQRGGYRNAGLRCDIGAYESGALPANLLFADGFETGELWAWG